MTKSDWLLVFDFDGVVADSEIVSNLMLAEALTELGLPTTLEDSYARYMGKRYVDLIAAIESDLGRPLPSRFAEDWQASTFVRFRTDLKPVRGVMDFLEAFSATPKCIASSSSPERLALCLDVLDLNDEFQPHVYSTTAVSRGKPHPDVFLHAADCVGIQPNRAIVLEDSPSGVEGGVAAGMGVIGLLAASHIGDGHGDRLLAAGASHVAVSFAEVEEILREIMA